MTSSTNPATTISRILSRHVLSIVGGAGSWRISLCTRGLAVQFPILRTASCETSLLPVLAQELCFVPSPALQLASRSSRDIARLGCLGCLRYIRRAPIALQLCSSSTGPRPCALPASIESSGASDADDLERWLGVQ